MQLTAPQLADLLDALIIADGPFDPAAVFIGLYTAITPHGLTTVMADLTRPTGNLATAVALTTFGAPYTMTDGRRVVDAALKQFRPTTSADGITALGWFLADAATAGNLLAYKGLPAPVPLPDENSSLGIVFRLTVDPNGRWDASVEYNG